MKNLIILLFIAFGLSGCFKRDSVISNKAELGMTKEEIIEKFGKPTKRSLHTDDHDNAIEVLFYKETTWDDGGWSYDKTVLNNMLILRNGKLIAIEQGDEQHKTQIINRYLVYHVN